MIIEAKVTPGSKRFSIIMEGDLLRIHLKSNPERNKANIELVNELSSLIGKPIRLVSGITSRKKLLDMDIEKEELQSLIAKRNALK